MRNSVLVFFILLSSSTGIAQNVGIGTGTPTRAKVEVIGVAGAGNTSGAFGTDGAGISLQRNWPTIGFNQYRDATFGQGKYMSNGYAAIQYFDINSGTMAIDMFPPGTANTLTPGGTRGLTILNNGNVGIRNTNPGATLTVGRGDGGEGTAVFAGTQIWSHFNYDVGESTYIRAGADGSNVYINKIPFGDVFIGNSNTRIGINNYTPGHTIDMVQPAGIPSISLHDEYGYSWHMQLSHVNVSGQAHGNMFDLFYGNMQAKGRFRYYDGQYVTFSDQRLKTNILPMPAVLPNLNLLKPVSYEMKNDNALRQRTLGFIAQDVKPLFPQLVRVVNAKAFKGENISDLHTMNYSGFGVIAIKALQEQWQQIKELEDENTDLLDRLHELEKKLSN
jgi:hypothetical protein